MNQYFKGEGSAQSELISVRKNKNETFRQNFRKNLPSSRFLDNYYNPNFHLNTWKPNGKVVRKK